MKMSYKDLFDRHYHLIGKSHNKVRNLKVAIAGLGGSGSTAATAIVKMGFTNIILSDFDTVEPANVANQSYNHDQIGKKKTEALKENLLKINPFIKITLFEGISEKNVDEFVKKADIVIDAMDSYRAKVILSRALKRHKKWCIHISSYGWRASLTCIPPTKSYEELFSLPSLGRPISEVSDEEFAEHRKKIVKIIGKNMYPKNIFKELAKLKHPLFNLYPSGMLSGILAAFETYKFAIGKKNKMIVIPRFLKIDLMFNKYQLSNFKSKIKNKNN